MTTMKIKQEWRG